MVEIKEVLRLWRAGAKKKRIAAQLTLDVKTVRRYIAAAESCQSTPGPEVLTDEQVAAVVAALSPDTGRPHGDGWQQCEAERTAIEKLLSDRVRLSKVRRLLHRRGVDVPYSTLHRFAVAELGFGQRAPTLPVVDGKPGEEIHIDTGWMQLLEADQHGKRRRFAVAADMVDVFRLERMLKLAVPPVPEPEPARVIPIGRYLRPATDYALLPCVAQAITEGEDS